MQRPKIYGQLIGRYRPIVMPATNEVTQACSYYLPCRKAEQGICGLEPGASFRENYRGGKVVYIVCDRGAPGRLRPGARPEAELGVGA